MPQDDVNRIAGEPTDMSGGLTEAAVEGLRGVLLLTPPGRAAEASSTLMALTRLQSNNLVMQSADMLGIGLTDPMDIHIASVHAHARMHFVSGTILSPLDNIPTSGVGRDAALAAIADTERANPGSFNRMLLGHQEDTAAFQSAVDAAVENPEAVLTPPVETGVTDENVRVTGGCRPLQICFTPQAKFRRQPLRREYDRQLRLQERGLNAMAPGDIVQNRAGYCALPPPRAPDPTQALAKGQYKRAYRRYLQTIDNAAPRHLRPGLALTRGARVNRHVRTMAALHNPDRIAGGAPFVAFTPADATRVLAGGRANSIGLGTVNSSIGSSWGGCNNPRSRSSQLEAHARQQAANGCPSVQVTLAIC